MHCSATKVENNGQAYDFAMKANPQMSVHDENGRRLRARALFCNLLRSIGIMLLSMDLLKSSVGRVGIHWIQRILLVSNCCLVPSLRLDRHKPLTVLHKDTSASAPVQGFLFTLHLPWNEVRISSNACATAEWSSQYVMPSACAFHMHWFALLLFALHAVTEHILKLTGMLPNSCHDSQLKNHTVHGWWGGHCGVKAGVCQLMQFSEEGISRSMTTLQIAC